MSQLTPAATTRPLGRSGLTVSSLAWGMWRFAGRTVGEAQALVEAAFEAGINFFDTADIYGFDGHGGFGDAETLLGQVFADAPHLRAKMVLASKGGIMPPIPYDSSPAYLEHALDQSLRRLRTDRIDLYQIHRPDILTHAEDVARFAEDAHARGKIRAFGVSNYTLAQTHALLALMAPGGISLASVQPELSPLELAAIEGGMLDVAIQHQLAPLAWSPLGGGRIAAPTTPREQAVASALDEVAAAHKVSRTAAAYSWIMAHPSRPIPIVGSQNAVRIGEAVDAYKIAWTRQTWYAVLVEARGEKLP